MSLRKSRAFGVRDQSRVVEPIKKYIFLFEGAVTEKQYFEGLFNEKESLGIRELVEIQTFERLNPSRSNQRDIVKNLELLIEKGAQLKQIKETIISDIGVLLETEQEDNYAEWLNNLREILEEEKFEELPVILETFAEMGATSHNKIDNIISTLSKADFSLILSFDSEIDTICIIIDRDKGSFTEEQYHEVIDICERNNYKLGITNPCFEFWLLLHFDDCQQEDLEKIKENKRISKSKSSKRFVEKLITNHTGSYNKNKVSFDTYKDGLQNAMENVKLYCEDIVLLKDEVGSSVGTVLRELVPS